MSGEIGDETVVDVVPALWEVGAGGVAGGYYCFWKREGGISFVVFEVWLEGAEMGWEDGEERFMS